MQTHHSVGFKTDEDDTIRNVNAVYRMFLQVPKFDGLFAHGMLTR